MMSLEEFNTGFNYLIGHFPNTKNLKSVSYAYFEDLKDTLTGNEFIFAIKKIVRNEKRDFIPGVQEIIETAKGTGDINNLIISAKKMLKAGIIRYGRTGMINFQDRGVHAVIDSLGGWTKLCEMNMDDFNKFLTFEFPKIYKAYKLMPYKVSQVCIGRNEDTTNVRFVGYNTMEIKAIETSKVKTEPTKGIDYSNLKKKMLLGG